MTREENGHSSYTTRGVPDLQPGVLVGNYQLVEHIGQGGMGRVWKASDIHGNRFVALKFLPPDFKQNSEAIAQVRSAFEVVHQLNHPCLSNTLGLFVDEQYGPYLVMQYVSGITLSEYCRRFPGNRLPLEQVISILRPVADALDYAHQIRTSRGEGKGVLHRDVKPQNIMLSLDADKVDRVSVIDFGLAAEIRSTVTRFTKAHVDARGTRPYMSPEQLSGKRSQWDGRSDQYSLAVVAYELLAGHPPFEAEDDFVLMQAIRVEAPDPIDSLPPLVNSALLKGLSKNKDDRFGTCLDFVEALAGHIAEPDLWTSEELPAMAAPIVETISAIPAPQVAASDLPPLPVEILSLEGRVSGLRVAIDSIDRGTHHDLRSVWKVLESRSTPNGQPVIGTLKAEIEKNPSRKNSELCALAPEAPQRTMLVMISGFKRMVELKGDCAAAEQELRRRQEEDFRGIIERFLARSDDETFPLPVWMKLEPMLAARRYVFVANLRELLEKAEQHFAAICDARKAERLRLAREQEEQRRNQEADDQRRASERQRKQRERAELAGQVFAFMFTLVVSAALGALAIGLLGAIIGAIGWQRVITVVVGAVLLVPLLAAAASDNRGEGGGCGCLLILIVFGLIASNGGFSYWSSAGGSSAQALAFAMWGAIVGLVVGPVVAFLQD